VELAKGNVVTVTGPKGTLTQTLPATMTIQQENGTITVSRPADSGTMRALHGLSRTLLANMVLGVKDGFSKSLELQGVGYRVAKVGENLVFQVGYSHPVQVNPPAGISFTTESNTRVSVSGIDKQLVDRWRRISAPSASQSHKAKAFATPEVVRMKAGKACSR
jgi:large subunit ribosomal protein L6